MKSSPLVFVLPLLFVAVHGCGPVGDPGYFNHLHSPRLSANVDADDDGMKLNYTYN